MVSFDHQYSTGLMDFSRKSRLKCAGCGQRFTSEGYLTHHENQCKKRKERSAKAWNAAAELKCSHSAGSDADTSPVPVAEPSSKRQETRNKLTSLLGLVQPRRKRAQKDIAGNTNNLPSLPQASEQSSSTNSGPLIYVSFFHGKPTNTSLINHYSA